MKWSRNLKTLQRGVRIAARLAKTQLESPPPPTRSGRFVVYDEFGDNPGRLRMFAHVPGKVAGRPLVVLLHGCGQNAARFAVGTRWIDAAENLGFPLILPEQAERNNPGRCFQWFEPGDTERGHGEAASIAQMVIAAAGRFDSDPRRIFIIGLSAGGAMAASMLAHYPDLFAAGAVVAGLPVGAAHNKMEAILRMASAHQGENPELWAGKVHDFQGQWPRLSIWHGLNDTTVAPDNGALLAAQWRTLHHLSEEDSVRTEKPGVLRKAWPAQGRPLVEQWSLPGFPHAYPIGRRSGQRSGGDYIEPAPVDATAEIIRFFGLD